MIRPPKLIPKKPPPDTHPNDPTLIRPIAAAHIAGVCVDTVYRWLDTGQLTGKQIGGRRWVDRTSLTNFLNSDIT